MIHRSIGILLLVAFANQSLWSMASSKGILFHRHGAFGFHAHILKVDDDADAAARSARWGHDAVREDAQLATSDVIILLFDSQIQPLPTNFKIDGSDELKPFKSRVDFCDSSIVLDTAADLIPEHVSTFCSPRVHSPGIRGLVESSHSLLI